MTALKLAFGPLLRQDHHAARKDQGTGVGCPGGVVVGGAGMGPNRSGSRTTKVVPRVAEGSWWMLPP